MASFDLQAILATARTQVRIATPKAAFKARLDQRDLVTIRAQEYANSLAKRDSLNKALQHEGVDAMRFRWLGSATNHSRTAVMQSAGQGLDALRRAIDHQIAHEAALHIAALRKERSL